MGRRGWIDYLAAADDYSKVIVWSLVLIGVIIILFVTAAWVKRWASRNADAGPVSGFSLSELRKLHQSGQLSQDEFNRAKEKIVQSARTMSVRPPEKTPGPPRDL
ncbi:MAG: SHOCT domain-containing protein [Phycisphaerales bacterium]|nr:SHOCT domain-containing protein [Phycisphaerales bacterium]